MKKLLLAILLAPIAWAGFAQQTIELTNWKFQTGDNIEWALPVFDDSGWKTVQAMFVWQILPEYTSYKGYAWYRIKFNLSSGLKQNAFTDSVMFVLGWIGKYDQAFLNGIPLGQNAKTLSENEVLLKDLSKLNGENPGMRSYTVPINDPRLFWDQENTLALRVYDSSGCGGLISLPVQIRMKNLKDYLSFDVNSTKLEIGADGLVKKNISIKKRAGAPEIKGKLSLQLTVAGSEKAIASQNLDVDLNTDLTPVTFKLKSDHLLKTANYTFTEAKTGAKLSISQAVPGIELSSSYDRLNIAFAWAKSMALSYVHDGDPAGKWYEAALPGRESFCMRDVAHQTIGAYYLGLGEYTKNMFARFAEYMAPSRKWCSFWEITKNNLPTSCDYSSDQDFWYCLPANFDIMVSCYDMYTRTGDNGYFFSEPLFSFHSHSVNEYVKTWDPNHDGFLETRVRMNNRSLSATYAEGNPDIYTALDVLVAQAKGYEVFAEMMKLQHKPDSAARYLKLAEKVRREYSQNWWDAKNNRFYAYKTEQSVFNGNLTDKGIPAWMEQFALHLGMVRENERVKFMLRHFDDAGNTESKSYLSNICYKYDQAESGYSRLLKMADPSDARRNYPEVSYAFVGSAVEGLMGLKLNAPENTIETTPKLTKETQWVEMKYIPWKTGFVSVRHEGLNATTLTSGANEPFTWRAVLPGNQSTLYVNGKAVKAKTTTNFNGEPMSYVEVTVNAGETISVSKQQQ